MDEVEFNIKFQGNIYVTASSVEEAQQKVINMIDVDFNDTNVESIVGELTQEIVEETLKKNEKSKFIMSKYFEISGYWLDDKEPFDGLIVKEFDDMDENDDDVFFYGMGERDLQIAIEDGEDTSLDFVVTGYEEINF